MSDNSFMATISDMTDNITDLSRDYYNLKTIVNDLSYKIRMYTHILKIMKKKVYGDDSRLIYSQFRNSIKFDSHPKEILGVYDFNSLEPINYIYDDEMMKVSVANNNDAQILYLLE